MGKEPYVRGFRGFEKAEKEKQAGIEGQWQLESPAREYLWQVKRRDDIYCTERMMKKGFAALKSGDWEEYKHFQKRSVSHGMGL